MKNTTNKEKEWYDNPDLITTMLIGVIILSIILSQSFAIRNHLDTGTILRSILNHNSLYLLALVYFIFIKTKIGKRYFHFLNIFISIVFCLTTIASMFTIFQSFGLSSLINLALNIVMTIYFIYVFIRDTVIGTELKINEAPMDEVNNNQYFYAIIGLIVVSLVVALISASTFDGIVIALLDAIYYCLFARYIFLYKEFQDGKKIVRKVEEKKEKGNEEKEETKQEVKELKDEKKKDTSTKKGKKTDAKTKEEK